MTDQERISALEAEVVRLSAELNDETDLALRMGSRAWTEEERAKAAETACRHSCDLLSMTFQRAIEAESALSAMTAERDEANRQRESSSATARSNARLHDEALRRAEKAEKERDEAEARGEVTRQALRKAHRAMQEWFSSEYVEHPLCREVFAALVERPRSVCPNCENGSGWNRRLGRDNDEIVEECRDHRTALLPAAPSTKEGEP
jgi:hypothetical protein